MTPKRDFAKSEGTPTLRGLVLDYLEEVEIRGRSDRTVVNYRAYLEAFLAWLGALLAKGVDALTVADLTAEHLRQYRLYLARRRDARSGRPIGATTRNLYTIGLRNLLRYCRGPRKLDVPDADEHLQLTKERDVEIRHLEPSEVARIAVAIRLDAPTGLRDRAIVETLFGTGVRVSELVSMKIRQVNLDRREAEVVGKGGRSRLILFTEESAGWLRRYLETRADDAPHLFVSNRRDEDGVLRPLGIRQVQRVVDDAARRAAIPFRVSPHWLRHGRLTVLARFSGVQVAQRVAGHSSLQTTSRYLHVSDEHLRAAFDHAEEAARKER